MANEKTFKAQVLTPEGSRFSGDVVSVSVPGASGSFQMLHNHAPIISSLDVGRVDIQKADNTTLTYAVSGGFVEMNDNEDGNQEIHVHHIIPFRRFGVENHKEANKIPNLICLCREHHAEWEGIPLRPDGS